MCSRSLPLYIIYSEALNSESKSILLMFEFELGLPLHTCGSSFAFAPYDSTNISKFAPISLARHNNLIPPWIQDRPPDLLFLSFKQQKWMVRLHWLLLLLRLRKLEATHTLQTWNSKGRSYESMCQKLAFPQADDTKCVC